MPADKLSLGFQFSKFGRELRYKRPKHRRTDVTAYRQTDVRTGV